MSPFAATEASSPLLVSRHSVLPSTPTEKIYLPPMLITVSALPVCGGDVVSRTRIARLWYACETFVPHTPTVRDASSESPLLGAAMDAVGCWPAPWSRK